MNDNENWVNERLTALGNPEAEWQPDAGQGFGRFREAQAKRKRWQASAGVLAIITLAALAFPTTRAFAHRCVDACVAQFTAMPTTTAPGSGFRLANHKGKVLVVNLWATWCTPCKTEIPWFNDFQQQYGPNGLDVVGISMDEDGWTSVRPFAEAQRIRYRLELPDNETPRQLGDIYSLPTTFLINRKGDIVKIHTGIASRQELQQEIEALLQEKP